MELNLNRLDYCQVSTTAPKCMHILSASGRKDPLQKVLYSSTLLWVHLHLDFLYFKIEDKRDYLTGLFLLQQSDYVYFCRLMSRSSKL